MFGGWLWNITTIDLAFDVLVTVVVAIFLIFLLQLAASKNAWLRKTALAKALSKPKLTSTQVVAVFLTVLGIYIAYGSLRNQMRMSAEAARNSDAYLLLEWEKDKPYIRCLYTWYSDIVSGEACLQEIVGDSQKFTETLLYVEEVFWILQASKRDAELYKSPYSSDIQFWRDDIEEDPTGIFSFHLINRYPVSRVTAEATDAGICIPDLCSGYERVRLALRGRRFSVDQPNICRTPQTRLMLRMSCEGR